MVQLAGLVVTRQRPGTAKGFLFLLAEDEFGLVNVVISPSLYEKRRTVVRGEPLILLRGTVQHRDGNLNLIAEEALPLIDFLCDSEPGAVRNPSFAFLEDLRRATPAAHQWR